MMHTRCRS